MHRRLTAGEVETEAGYLCGGENIRCVCVCVSEGVRKKECESRKASNYCQSVQSVYHFAVGKRCTGRAKTFSQYVVWETAQHLFIEQVQTA